MIGEPNVYIAISGCWSLSQSPGISFIALGVVENPKFAVGIVTLSVMVPEISGFVGHIATGDTLFRLAIVENPGLAVGILDAICCSSGGISISGLGGHIVSGCPSLSHLFLGTFFWSLVWSKTLCRARITVILILQIY